MVCRQIKLASISTLIVCLHSLPIKAAELTLRLYDGKRYEQVKTLEIQKTQFSANCLKNGKPSCDAWTVFSGKPKPESQNKTPLAGDPAAKYCWDVGSKNRILKSADNKQYDYCVFNDGSMVDAW
ncbi:MAG: DUF333 domain-containing protein, partial [Bdellovibrio sp.]